MRSPNKRSRTKGNRPKSLGNIVNRVFDSSGPEGKVRGTPQQIIEKYQVLARDAQLSNDRVAAENFQQHAEHYTRLLAQAQRELQAEQDARRQQHEEQQRSRQNQDDRQQHNQRRHEQRRAEDEALPENGVRNGAAHEPSARDSFSVQDADVSAETSLVETPESRAEQGDDSVPAPESRPANRRKPRAPKAEAADAGAGEAAPKPRRAPRKAPQTVAGSDVKSSAAE
jgi:hypothetical protein